MENNSASLRGATILRRLAGHREWNVEREKTFLSSWSIREIRHLSNRGTTMVYPCRVGPFVVSASAGIFEYLNWNAPTITTMNANDPIIEHFAN